MSHTKSPRGEANLNGYEIRLKLLELAQTQAFQPVMARAGMMSGAGLSTWETEQITFPSDEEVLAIANKFYSFVSNK